MKEMFTLPPNKSFPRRILSEEAFRKEMRNMIPEAVFEIQDMLTSTATPPATKAKLIDLILKYGMGENVKTEKTPDVSC